MMEAVKIKQEIFDEKEIDFPYNNEDGYSDNLMPKTDPLEVVDVKLRIKEEGGLNIWIKEEPKELVEENTQNSVEENVLSEDRVNVGSADNIKQEKDYETSIKENSSGIDLAVSRNKDDESTIKVVASTNNEVANLSKEEKNTSQYTFSDPSLLKDVEIKSSEAELSRPVFPDGGFIKLDMDSFSEFKPHKCTECDKSFAIPRSLRRHMRLHTGENVFKCTECKKVFTQSDHLKVHMRSHTGVKPFKCTVCEKAFNHSDDKVKWLCL